mmetsp:Transcript_60675/g.195499  ORF Transcript_60675/g.195499 Transcript_60675/m.195499 type:complete len:205 (-) Transcript_60675:640-1254(-)
MHATRTSPGLTRMCLGCTSTYWPWCLPPTISTHQPSPWRPTTRPRLPVAPGKDAACCTTAMSWMVTWQVRLPVISMSSSSSPSPSSNFVPRMTRSSWPCSHVPPRPACAPRTVALQKAASSSSGQTTRQACSVKGRLAQTAEGGQYVFGRPQRSSMRPKQATAASPRLKPLTGCSTLSASMAAPMGLAHVNTSWTHARNLLDMR